MFHYLYQIMSLVPDENGVCKIYSGIHSDENRPELDNYFGSGTLITEAVKTHGRDKFVKTIIKTFESREEALHFETQWLRKLFFNFYGGSWDNFNKHHFNRSLNYGSSDVYVVPDDIREKQRERMLGENNPMFGKYGAQNPWFGCSPSERSRELMREKKIGKKPQNYGKPMSEEQKEKLRVSCGGENNYWYGKNLSDEHKQKLREQKLGSNGSNFLGFTVGSNRTSGQTIVFDGSASMKAKNFNSGGVYQVVGGKRSHYKNFTFIRTTDPDYLRQLLAEDNFHDEQSKTILQNFLS